MILYEEKGDESTLLQIEAVEGIQATNFYGQIEWNMSSLTI